jgi:hypothetical protein
MKALKHNLEKIKKIITIWNFPEMGCVEYYIKQQIMKNTTILRTAPNGTLYHVSQHFSVGDTVAIHNTLTGECRTAHSRE